MPRIGAGYGGLEWPDVRAIIESIAVETPVVLAVYERPWIILTSCSAARQKLRPSAQCNTT
jgi:hypothetical protein